MNSSCLSVAVNTLQKECHTTTYSRYDGTLPSSTLTYYQYTIYEKYIVGKILTSPNSQHSLIQKFWHNKICNNTKFELI